MLPSCQNAQRSGNCINAPQRSSGRCSAAVAAANLRRLRQDIEALKRLEDRLEEAEERLQSVYKPIFLPVDTELSADINGEFINTEVRQYPWKMTRYGEAYYSPRYSDDRYTYRHVILSRGLRKQAERLVENMAEGFLSEEVFVHFLGVTLSPGWQHFMRFNKKLRELVLRRPQDSQGGDESQKVFDGAPRPGDEVLYESDDEECQQLEIASIDAMQSGCGKSWAWRVQRSESCVSAKEAVAGSLSSADLEWDDSVRSKQPTESSLPVPAEDTSIPLVDGVPPESKDRRSSSHQEHDSASSKATVGCGANSQRIVEHPLAVDGDQQSAKEDSIKCRVSAGVRRRSVSTRSVPAPIIQSSGRALLPRASRQPGRVTDDIPLKAPAVKPKAGGVRKRSAGALLVKKEGDAPYVNRLQRRRGTAT